MRQPHPIPSRTDPVSVSVRESGRRVTLKRGLYELLTTEGIARSVAGSSHDLAELTPLSVDETKEVTAGHDPQLERAVAEAS